MSQPTTRIFFDKPNADTVELPLVNIEMSTSSNFTYNQLLFDIRFRFYFKKVLAAVKFGRRRWTSESSSMYGDPRPDSELKVRFRRAGVVKQVKNVGLENGSGCHRLRF